MAEGSREELWAMYALLMALPAPSSVFVDPDDEGFVGTTFTVPVYREGPDPDRDATVDTEGLP